VVSETVISLRGVVALLGRFPALARLDLDVDAGEIVLVRGPNGAGKSTLLRVCAGLVPVDSGNARVLGHDLRADRRVIRRSVGYLGHDTGLYADLTVRDNVRFWARATGASGADADAAMVRLDLDTRLADIIVARLSAGQRRRVGLAVLLAQRPKVWLLDEPHAALDENGRDVLDEVLRQAAAGGAAVLVASHDHGRAEQLAHRSVSLAGGHVHSVREPGGTGVFGG